MKKIILSIVVPVLNDSKRLLECLESVKKQNISSLEFIVVDENDSIDSAKDITKRFPFAKYLSVIAGSTVPFKRNAGAKEAVGDYLYFIDADMVFPAGFIAKLIDTLNDKKPEIVFVPERTKGSSWLARMKNLEKKIIENNIYLSGARIYSKNFFAKLEGYNESLSNGEDLDISDRAISLSKKYMILSNHVIHNETSSNSLCKHLIKKFRYGASTKKYLKTGDMVVKRGTSRRLDYFKSNYLYEKPFQGFQFMILKIVEISAMAFGMLFQSMFPVTKKKIIFLGTHGQKNLGDEFLLEAFMNIFQGNYDLSVNSYNPGETRKKFKNTFHTFYTDRNFLHFLRLIFSSNVLVFGGGNIIKELYTKYGGKKYAVLIKLFLITVFARTILRKKMLFLNIGIGPIESKRGVWMAKYILNSAEHISVRDSYSYEYAKKLKISNVIQVPDIVFSLPQKIKTATPPKKLDKVAKICLNLCPNIEKPENWEPFLNAVEFALLALCKEYPKCEIIGIPMQWAFEKNDDFKTLTNFRSRLYKKAKHIRFTTVKPSDAAEIQRILYDCDLLLSERLHLLIIAISTNKPFIGLMYDVKVKALLRDTNLDKCGVDLSEEIKEDSIYKKIRYVQNNYGVVHSRMKLIAKEYKSDLSKYISSLKRII